MNVPWPLMFAIGTTTPFRPGGLFERLVAKHSDGRITVDVQEMLYEADAFFAVADGRIEMGNTATPDFSGTLPLPDFTSLPGLFAPFPDGLYEAAAAVYDPRLDAILQKTYRTQGVVAYVQGFGGPQVLWANKPADTVASLAGLKVRSSGLIQAATADALSMNPVIATEVEVQELLARGTVDGILTDIPYGAAIGLLDLADNLDWWEITPNMCEVILINAEVWDGLPNDLQESLKSAIKELLSSVVFAEELGTGYLIPWVESSVDLVYPAAGEAEKMGSLLRPVYEEWLKIAGPDGKAVLGILSEYGTGGGAAIAAELSK